MCDGVNLSGRQAVPTFGATTLEYQTTTLGGHAGTETVGTLTLDLARLESTFHGTSVRVAGRAT